MRRRFTVLGLTFAVGLAMGLGPAGDAEAKKPKKAFKDRFAALTKARSVIKVAMKSSDDPEAIPDSVKSGMVNVAGGRMGIYEPEVLSPQDMMAVVNQHMVDIRKCYKKQLADDPDWADDMILDIAVKRSGRVSQVEISPSRVRKDSIGKCLISRVPKWEFPRFTGEVGDGMTQEVVNASVPLSFSTN